MRKQTPQGARNDLGKAGIDRRQALKTVSRFAVYVSPVMTVLLKGEPAGAHHKPNHSGGGGQCNNKPWLSFC